MGKNQITIVDCQKDWQQAHQYQHGARRLHVQRNRSGWLAPLKEKLPRLKQRWQHRGDLLDTYYKAGQGWSYVCFLSEQASRIWFNVDQLRKTSPALCAPHRHRPCFDESPRAGSGGHRAARRLLQMRGEKLLRFYGPRWDLRPPEPDE